MRCFILFLFSLVSFPTYSQKVQGPLDVTRFSEIACTDSVVVALEKGKEGDLFNRLYYSWDTGKTWQTFDATYVIHIASVSQTIFKFSINTIAISTDHGRSWTETISGIAPELSYGNVKGIYVDGNSIYMSTTYHVYLMEDVRRKREWTSISDMGATSIVTHDGTIYTMVKHEFDDNQEYFYLKEKKITISGKVLRGWKTFAFPKKDWNARGINSIEEHNGHLQLTLSGESKPLTPSTNKCF